MAVGKHTYGPMIPAGDVASIAATAVANHGSEFTSKILQVWDKKTVVIAGYVTGGNASATGNVLYKFQASYDGTNWDTVYFYTLTTVMTGTTKAQKSELVNVYDYHSIRLYEIENEDSSYAATLINSYWAKSYGQARR